MLEYFVCVGMPWVVPCWPGAPLTKVLRGYTAFASEPIGTGVPEMVLRISSHQLGL